MDLDLTALRRAILADPAGMAEALFYKTMEPPQYVWRHPEPRDPVLWDQADLITAPFRYQKIAVGTGHGVAKTESMSVIVPLWLLSHYPSYVIMTSASWKNLEEKVIPSIRAKMARIDPAKELPPPVADKWVLGDEWAAIALSPTVTEVAQGWHASGGTLVIGDEASFMEHPLFQSLMSLIKSKLDCILLWGNPTRSEGILADILRRSRGYEDWCVRNMSSENTPNVRATQAAIAKGLMTDRQARYGDEPGTPGREIIVIPGLITYSQVRSWEETHGRDSAVFCGRVLGIPPDQSEDTLIARSWLAAACRRDVPEQSDGLRLIVDVAWSETGDRTVFALADDKALYWMHGVKGLGEAEIRHRIRGYLRELPEEVAHLGAITQVRIDRCGIGVMLYGNLAQEKAYGDELLAEVDVIGVDSAQPAVNTMEYANVRAEMWCELRDQLRAGFAIAPQFEQQLQEITALTYAPNAHGKLVMEPKVKFKSRMGYSPDYGDTLAMNFARVEGDRQWVGVVRQAHQLAVQPVIEMRDDGRAWLHLPDAPGGYDRPGALCRAFVYNRSGASGAVWVHVDDDSPAGRGGCWTVYHAMLWQPGAATTLREMWTQVEAAWPEHDFALDVVTALEESANSDEHRVMDVVYAVSSEQRYRYPQWVPPSRITGIAGLDTLDRLLLGTLAKVPGDAYWQSPDAVALTDDLRRTGDMLVVWPREVHRALAAARRVPTAGAKVYHDDIDRTSDLVGGGGPLVRALRLLTVTGAQAYAVTS